jgi:hypothetical protein
MSTAVSGRTRTRTPDDLDATTAEKPATTARRTSISRNQIFEVLSNDRRQYVVQCLLKRGESTPVPLGEVVDYVAAREYDLPFGEIDAARRKRVYTAVRQCHLPKLDEYDVVEFDSRRSEVAPGPAVEDVRPYLAYDPRTTPAWNRRYLGLSAIAALVALLSFAGVGPVGAVTSEALVAAIVGSFATAAGVHTCRSAQSPLSGRDS